MKTFWQKYLDWREEKRQKHFEHWGKDRQKGHPRFVLGVTFFYGAWMVIGTSLIDYYLHGFFDWWSLLITIPTYFILGFVLGAFLWWDNERKYQKILKDKNVS